jgi:hypothetical protein
VYVGGICGDLDFFNKDLGTPAMNADSFCWRCSCNRTDKPWNDFRPTAAWRTTVLNAGALKNLEFPLPLFRFAGLTPAMLHLDVMHVLDLGITEHVVANILFTICYHDMPGRGSAAKQLCFNQLWIKIQEAYGTMELEHKISNLSLKCIVADIDSPFADYPALRRVKAAECKHLLRALQPLLVEFTTDSIVHQHRLRMYTCLIQVYDAIERSPNFITDFPAMLKAAQQFQLHYQVLAKLAMEAGQKLWSVVNKFHFFEHLVDQAKYENPALFWAYSGEDFVGRVSRLAHMCSYGKPVAEMVPVLMDRYRIGLHFTYTRLA